MFAPGPVSQTVGANDAFLNNMSQTAKDANTLSKAAGIDTNFTKNTVANALRNTSSNTRLTSKFGRNKMNESLDNVIKKAEIYVDMDGVLADFFGVWTKMVGVKQWKDIKNVDGALDMIRDKKDFWINLPLAPNASKLLNSIKKVKGNYNILSSPLPNYPNSEPHKREWVKKIIS